MAETVGDFISSHPAPVSLRDTILYVRVLQPAAYHELETIAKADVLRKRKKRFGAKPIREIRFRVG